ncbi:MAG: LysE family translocator [Alphaproteobacteria bacterium]
MADCAVTWEQTLSFSLFALVTSITPGPNNVMLTALGANFGIARGLPCVFGVSAGFCLMLGLVVTGLGSVILANPEILDAIRWLGAAFLLWLAWKVATAHRVDPDREARPVGFLGAAAFQWVNPKAWLIATSAAATYLEADAGSALAQSAAFGGIFFLAAVPCCLAWLAFGAALQRLLHTPRRLRLFNIAMGLTLAGSVVMFVA